MMTELFHAEVFVPEAAKAPIHEGSLRYGRHALDKASSDRYGGIQLPNEFHAVDAKLIEAEVLLEHGKCQVVKQVWRQPLDHVRDLVLVIGTGGFVKTVWVNLRNDKHRSLDRSKYTSSKRWSWLQATA